MRPPPRPAADATHRLTARHNSTDEVQKSIVRVLHALNAAFATNILHSPLLFSLPDGGATLSS